MNKRIVAVIVSALMAAVLLSACAAGSSAGTSASASIEKKAVPARIQMGKNLPITDSEVNLYFVNGGDIPYVALSEYLPIVGSIYEDADLGISAVEYEISRPGEGHVWVKRADNEAVMDIDPAKDTIEFLGMNQFVATPGSSSLLAIISMGESGTGGHSNLLQDDGSSYERASFDNTTLDLSEYEIDLIDQDGECYVPLQTVSDLLVSRTYLYVVYNGEKLIIAPHQSELIDEMYEAETGPMSEDFAKFNYNELRFLLDYFYGLKPEHDIDNFGDFFLSTGLWSDLSGTDPKAFDDALRMLTLKYFDDGHSGLLKESYLAGKADLDDTEASLENLKAIGTSMSESTWSGFARKEKRAEHYPDHPDLAGLTEDAEQPWFYEEVGDTAIITFDEFSAKKKDYYTEADLKNPQDTIELISYAQSRITRKNSPIKNVVLDLSCNGGGDADAAVFTIAWFKSFGKVALRDTLTGAQSVCSYAADINLDKQFDDLDALPAEVNRYCIISGSSFSCGNLVPAAFKDSDSVTLLGVTSGGGTCAVLPCTTASGAIFAISGTYQISTVKNGSFYNIDRGVEPDFVVKNMDILYDRTRLVEYIHGLQ